MKITIQTKKILVESISFLYILLFVYAAANKVLDFEHFLVQLGQSPLLGSYAGYVAYLVPVAELIIAALLMFPLTRFSGLLAAFSLMLMFTAYIIIILNWSSFIPCSCGGILSKMGWKEHLVFNIVFVMLGLVGIIIQRGLSLQLSAGPAKHYFLRSASITPRRFSMLVSFIFTSSILAVVLLYLFSEESIHRNNSFLRRYPNHPVNTIKGHNIKYNSYYIAGMAGGKIYLGNTTAPLHLLRIDTTLSRVDTVKISLDGRDNYRFTAVQVRVREPFFYVTDGNQPILFRGRVGDWKAMRYGAGTIKFSQMEPIDSTCFAIRAMDKITNENILGVAGGKNGANSKTAPYLLEKQIDGIFDTDGILSYNSDLKQIVYVYYYRNQYVVADTNLKLLYRGRTIDTVRSAAIKIAVEDSARTRSLAYQASSVIQHYSTTSGRYLYTKSDRLGRYEPEDMLGQASIIDVYDLKKQTYEFSFYLYDYENEKVKSFKVFGNLLVGLTQHYIVLYRLESHTFNLQKL